MKEKCVLVLGSDDYGKIFSDNGFAVIKQVPNNFKELDLICFTGGVDIDPIVYGNKKHRLTGPTDRRRDIAEINIFNKARENNIPMVGICRGAQLLCVLSGGDLYQHVDNHTTSHEMYTQSGDILVVTSSHHQMMNLNNFHLFEDSSEKYPIVLGWAPNRSHKYYSGEGLEKAPDVDYEVVYFPDTRSLAHQPHPEWMDTQSPYYNFFFGTIEKLLENKF